MTALVMDSNFIGSPHISKHCQNLSITSAVIDQLSVRVQTKRFRIHFVCESVLTANPYHFANQFSKTLIR